MILIRKYLIIFFGVLLIFIWLSHRSKKDDLENSFEYFPPVSKETTLGWVKADFIAREKQLRELVQRGRIAARITADQQETKTESPDDNVADDVIDNFKFENNPSQETKPSRYFVNSTKCKIPYADPFSREAMAVYNPTKLKVCTNTSDLFSVNYDRNTDQFNLHVNREVLRKLNLRVASYKCNYREVTRSVKENPERNSQVHRPVYFDQQCTLPQHVRGIIAECHDANNASRILQRDAFALVHANKKSARIESHPLERQPSVIILGLDSMSRMNFQRIMPETAKFVRQEGWFEMEGYNKMEDSTLLNLMPVLMGQKWKQFYNCDIQSEGCFDQLPFIWKDYKSAGYATALGEDTIDEGLFVAGFPGFAQEPVDYYLRPFLIGISRSMNIYQRFGYQYCIGRRLSISYVNDFCLQFTSRFAKEVDQPMFGFFWSCTFTHDFHFAASSLDAKFVDYLYQLRHHELFDKSIVILMSDHGAQFGELLELPDNFLEERLPMLHIYLPPWFRNTYPNYAEALHKNRNRLSSNFDLHNTLKHILRLNATTQADLPPLASCPTSQSLLHPLPEERSCQDACIGEHWCTCNEFVRQPLTGDIYLLGKLIVYHINRWMLVHQYNHFCQRILLQDMEYAQRKVLYEENGKETMYGSIVTYRLRFRTYPESAKFQTTVRYHRELKTIEGFNVPDISRVNYNRKQAECIDDKIAKKFCFCYPKTKLNGFMDNWKNTKLTTLAT
ncbi:uncharacterized protein LOC135439177 [Drosophila montana]|uniref:uncharacterized protein LOC135439177 n=1 Tax=Drosophila montana TaxID=40370 RepID=UPI00313B0C60